jgi:DNA invertase Pin-like site-specific DNA recombinase
MLIGYARTSTAEQEAGLDAQIRDLKAAGCERTFSEQVSATSNTRLQLETALAYCRDGDTLVVTKLDRLARSMAHTVGLVDALKQRDIGLRILSFGGSEIDTTSATGRMMLNLFASVAQFELELMRERQIEGIAKAKTEGKYKGRVPTAQRQAQEARNLFKAGKSRSEIMAGLGISRTSLFQILKAA